MRKNKGITLIALVVTIVVLLILAGISLNMVLGQNGIIKRAGEAKKNYSNASEEEDKTSKKAEKDMDKLIKGPPSEPTDIYAVLYTDGTLVLSNNDVKETDKTVKKDYGNVRDEKLTIYTSYDYSGLWANERASINQVVIKNKIVPTNMVGWFMNLGNLTELDLTNIDTSCVSSMQYLFLGCTGLTSLDLKSFDTSNVTDMGCMIAFCSSLTSLDLSTFDTSNVTDMRCIFEYCEKLTSIDIHTWDTSNVTSMRGMFYYCP